jgi:hypothetical protein
MLWEKVISISFEESDFFNGPIRLRLLGSGPNGAKLRVFNGISNIQVEKITD